MPLLSDTHFRNRPGPTLRACHNPQFLARFVTMGMKAHAVEPGPTSICFHEQMRFGDGFLRAWTMNGELGKIL
jgi:hypothetical protein